MDKVGEVAELFRRAIADIKALPGFEGFLDRPRFAEIAAVARVGEPIAYVFAAPSGSAILIVRAEGGGSVELIEAPELTSNQIVQQLFNMDGRGSTLGGYLFAQAGETEGIDDALSELGVSIGEHLMKPLADRLAAIGAHGVTLIPIALMGLLPLHSLEWKDPARSCLLDKFDVAFAPSARVRLACLRRADLYRGNKRFLALANPLPHPNPLPGAELEIRMVLNTFPSEETEVLLGTAATKKALVESLPGATYVHLACHGDASALGEVLSANLSLANTERLSARDLVDVEGLSARLVVASACQTAVVQGYETVDEVLGIGTAFLWAGAAGVVATLWPVDDYATALVMCRFYELLAHQLEAAPGGINPAAALRGAQLWLRSLTASGENPLVAGAVHPCRHLGGRRTPGWPGWM